MIEEAHWPIDYDECGAGPTIVLVPGSCSTGAAWRPVIGALGDAFRCVTTSLLGYGGTAERRTASDAAITYEVETVEAVVRRAGGRVHLVGHSFGGLVALAVALRGEVPLASLTIAEAPAAELLRARRGGALPRLPPDDQRIFCCLRGRRPGCDRGYDRFLWR
jgi:pimeloyl-ACP methyl ester carboxylesterase